ncbi:MAG TPA: hypothetical protein VHG28_19790, partial [Longimicrobiaceae bacterium]|nr:hypothetical protein [Longimicrobiaceae bacterium]
MTEIERVPRAGYLLGEVYTLEQHYKVLSPEELGGGDLEDVSAEATEEEVERDFQIVWDWQIVREGVFAVFLGIGVHPTRQAPEEIRVAIIGEFAVEGEAQSLRFQPFVQVSAPAILFPYLRETVR